MENFYDVNDFLVFVIKKWKTLLGIILVITLLYVGNRANGLITEYKNQQNTTQTTNSEVTTTEEPMWTKVIINIRLDSIYQDVNGDTMDVTSTYIDGLKRMASSETVMNEMYSNWYAKESQEDVLRKQKFNSYGYILDKEVNYAYAKYDFQNQFIIEGIDFNTFLKQIGTNIIEKNYVSVGFKSTNSELANEIARDYAACLIKHAQEELGEFSYDDTEVSVLYELPTRSEGTQTSRIAKTTTVNNITKSYIVKQLIKGVVWGFMLGALVAIVVIFFVYMMNRKIYVLNDLKKYELTILGVGFSKKSPLNKLAAKVYSVLEGNKWDTNDNMGIVQRIKDRCAEEQGVWVTGSCDSEIVQKMVNMLNEGMDVPKYVFGKCVNESWEIIQEDTTKKVLLVERFGDSMKEEISQEIKTFNEQNMEILGILGLE